MEFDEVIERKISGSICYKSDVMTSSSDQRYKLVINRIVWYGVHILFEIDPRLNNDDFQVEFKNIHFKTIQHQSISQHLTLSGAKEKVAKLENDFNMNKIFPSILMPFITPFLLRCKVKDREKAKNDPDCYFLPGDHVQVARSLYHHSAIYIGNKKVIHVSDPSGGASKEQALVNEADWSKFHCGDTEISVLLPMFKLKANVKVANDARLEIGNYKSEYNVLFKNCQHFATYCQFGKGYSCSEGLTPNVH